MLKQLARKILGLVPKGTVVPVMSGPLRGSKWVVGAGTNGCWIGTYEKHKQSVFLNVVHQGGTVFDVGANVGFYTLLSSKLVGETGSVHSFEPYPDNIDSLNRHITLNNCKNVVVHPQAVGQQSGKSRFSAGGCAETGKLDANGEIEVEVLGIDEEILSGNLPVPNAIKIDVEGAEVNVLLGARQLLLRHRPVLLVAIHGTNILREIRPLLEGFQYELDVQTSGDPGLYELFARPIP